MRKRFTLHIVVLAVVLLATCAFAGVPSSAVMANNTLVLAVPIPTPCLSTTGIEATANKDATTGANIKANIAGLEANSNTANTGAINTVGTALVNEGTINAGANDANIAGANKKVEQNNLAKNAMANTGGGSGNAAGAGSA